MQKCHIYSGDWLAVVRNNQAVIVSEGTDDAGLNLFGGTYCQQRFEMLRRNGEHHTLLRLGEPDFPWGQALIFERRVCQFNLNSCPGSHLAHRGGEASRAAVGN